MIQISHDMKTMTLDEAFCYAMNCSPLLYIANNVKNSKLKYLNQVFNVAGNGLNTEKQLIEKHLLTKENQQLTINFPKKYQGKEDLYLVILLPGEHKIIANGQTKIIIENHLKALPELYTQDELKLFSDDILSSKVYTKGKLSIFKPTPNFNKASSIIWSVDFSKMDISWLFAAQYFYKESEKYINSSKALFYVNDRDEGKIRVFLKETLNHINNLIQKRS